MSDNQRENIIETAQRKMREVGIRSVSIDDLCKELGMSKKTFYVYFETKDQLLDTLLRRKEEEIERDVEHKTEHKPVIDLMMDFFKIAKHMKDVRQVPPLLYDLEKYYPQQLAAHLTRLKEINRVQMRKFLLKGMEEGVFRADLDADTTAHVFASLHQIMMDKLSKSTHAAEMMADARYAMDIFFRGLITPEAERQIKERIKK